MSSPSEARPGAVVLVTDRSRHAAVLRGLVADVDVWGYGPAARGADRKLREALARPPDLPRDVLFYVDLDPKRAEDMLPALQRVYPRGSFVLDPRAARQSDRDPRALVSAPAAAIAAWAHGCRDLAEVRARVGQLRARLDDARQIVVLTHPNPDPDAIAAALAMRTVLGRDRRTCTLGYLGRPLSRPENVTMLELLEIDLVRLEPKDLPAFDAIILVDCQENLFTGLELPPVAAVIDHHPDQAQYSAAYRDVVPEEGSTSTILTRYLQALQIEPSQRLATALLYGIKSDTLFLHREVGDDDLAGFLYLYPRANVNLLRRIETPELPLASLKLLGQALEQACRVGEIFVAGIDAEGAREDLAARLADFGLQAKGATWSLAWVRVGDELVVSVRNVGWVRHAGRAVEAAWGRWGPAGGHRSAARAIFPLARLGVVDAAEIGAQLLTQLAEQIRPDDAG